MTKPVVSNCSVDFEEWEFYHDENKTLRQNADDIANAVLDEVWGTLDIQISTDGLAIGYLLASSDAEWTFSYFKITDMVREALHRIATNYFPPFREEHIEDTREHMRAIRDVFADALQIIDGAISDPESFTSEDSTTKTGDDDEKVVSYLKENCGALVIR